VPSNSLAGFSITFVSFSSNFHSDFTNKTLAQLKDDIANRGGTYVTKVEQCTHLIATADQYAKNLVRVHVAVQTPGVKIVSYDWLALSLSSNTSMDDEPYRLDTDTNDDRAEAVADEPKQSVPKSKKTAKRAREEDDEAAATAVAEEDTKKSAAPPKKPKSSTAPASSKRNSKRVKKDVPVVAKSRSINIPVDEHCPGREGYQVYIDEDGVVFDVTLNQTNAGRNNNKFYRLQLLAQKGQYWCWTRWGRVGEKGQSKMLGQGGFDGALNEFQKKFKDKNGNPWDKRDAPTKLGRYTFIELNYEDSDDEKDGSLSGSGPRRRPSKESLESEGSMVESTLPLSVQDLMALIFNLQYFSATMQDLEYDANKMPLGKLSKKTLLKGYEVLKDLAAVIADASLAGGISARRQAIEEKSNQYFSLVPHVASRQRAPLIQSLDALKREIELLETLTDMQLANEIMKSAKTKQVERVNIVDRQYQGLGMQEVTPLDVDSTEYYEIHEYLTKSVGSTHNIHYQIQDIFRIERDGEHDRFNHSTYASLGQRSDRRLLWHGSRCTNFGGILSQGLRIAPPEAPVTGYMFGKGIYLADMSSKSANYCVSSSTGGVGLLLLCEAELGKPSLKLVDSDYNAGERAKANNCISTWGVGQTVPQGWKDAGCIVSCIALSCLFSLEFPAQGVPSWDRPGLAWRVWVGNLVQLHEVVVSTR